MPREMIPYPAGQEPWRQTRSEALDAYMADNPNALSCHIERFLDLHEQHVMIAIEAGQQVPEAVRQCYGVR